MQRHRAAARAASSLLGLAVLAGGATVAAAAPAAPAATRPNATVTLAPETVQYRGWDYGNRHWRGHRYGYGRWGDRYDGWGPRYRYYGYGPGIAAGVAAIIGGSIAASQRDYGDAWQRCDDRYNSFRWSDGTFQPYGDGPRQLCPYLRD